MPMTPLPGLDRTSPAFKAELDTFFLTRLPQFVTEANALEVAVEADKVAAAGSETAAALSASNAAASQAAAALSQASAATSAASALNAPGTSATSATALLVGDGSKTLTVQTGKLFVPGQTVVLASAANPDTVQMVGIVTAHDSATGAMTISVASGAFAGAGTYSDWIVSLTVPPVATPQLIQAAGAVASPFAMDAAIVFAIAMS